MATLETTTPARRSLLVTLVESGIPRRRVLRGLFSAALPWWHCPACASAPQPRRSAAKVSASGVARTRSAARRSVIRARASAWPPVPKASASVAA